jgi:hypothetical protein
MKQARVNKNDAGFSLSIKTLNHIVYLPVDLFVKNLFQAF